MEKTLILNWKHHWVDQWSLYIPLLQNNPFLFIAPPAPLLGLFAQFVPNQVLSSHLTPHSLGSVTGACGPQYLQKLAVNTALLGHSEQREYIAPQMLLSQIHYSLEHGMKVILCVGEANPLHYQKELFEQLQFLLNYPCPHLSIAYEPKWAIGTGQACSMDHLDKVLHFLRQLIPLYNQEKRYYGGSVDQNNVQSFLKRDDLDGLLLGSMSLKIDLITKLAKEMTADLQL